jgi:amino acid transporter
MEITTISLVIIAAFLAIVGLALAVLFWKRRREGKVREVNYRVFYIVGIVMISIGVVWVAISLATDLPFTSGIPLIGVGAAYIAIGAANRDKWHSNR